MKTILKFVWVSIAVIIPTEFLFTYSSTPPNGYTNAPGENNCTSCHSSYTLVTSGQKWDSLTLTQNTPLGNGSSASPYSFTLKFKDKNRYKYGFQLCALPSNANNSTYSFGTLSVNPISVIETQLSIAPDRQYIEHTSSGVYATSHSKSWTFNWVPPVSGYTGNVNFYVCVNSTDDDSYTGGDSVYAKVFSLQVLPVTWLNFTAIYHDKKTSISLNWSTSTEQNNNRFEIESALENEYPFNWKCIGKLKGANNSNVISNYSFEHSIMNYNLDRIYYRIKQIDNDGRYSYSKILSVKTPNDGNIEFYPNPCSDKIFVKNISKDTHIKIYKLSGDLVKEVFISDDKIIDFHELKSGIYQLVIDNESMPKISKIIIL